MKRWLFAMMTATMVANGAELWPSVEFDACKGTMTLSDEGLRGIGYAILTAYYYCTEHDKRDSGSYDIPMRNDGEDTVVYDVSPIISEFCSNYKFEFVKIVLRAVVSNAWKAIPVCRLSFNRGRLVMSVDDTYAYNVERLRNDVYLNVRCNVPGVYKVEQSEDLKTWFTPDGKASGKACFFRVVKIED